MLMGKCVRGVALVSYMGEWYTLREYIATTQYLSRRP